MIRKILLSLAALFVLAQLFQPDRSVPVPDPARDMLAMTNAPAEISTLFKGACYDCHSYSTEYPWYSYITPVNFWQQHHINEGREAVNYAEWDRNVGSEAATETGETIAEGEMPPRYYSFMHDHGRLTTTQKDQLIAWANVNIGGEGGIETTGSGEEEEEDHE